MALIYLVILPLNLKGHSPSSGWLTRPCPGWHQPFPPSQFPPPSIPLLVHLCLIMGPPLLGHLFWSIMGHLFCLSTFPTYSPRPPLLFKGSSFTTFRIKCKYNFLFSYTTFHGASPRVIHPPPTFPTPSIFNPGLSFIFFIITYHNLMFMVLCLFFSWFKKAWIPPFPLRSPMYEALTTICAMMNKWRYWKVVFASI